MLNPDERYLVQEETKKEMAKVYRDSAVFFGKPYIYTIMNITVTALKVIGSVSMLAIIGQCTCNGCIW